jgi:hypothetical protein
MVSLCVLAACGAGGDASGGEKNLPTSGAGPFRALTTDEVKGFAPFVLEDAKALYREPAVLRDGDATLLYAVARRTTARGAADVIVRTRALDERSFFGGSGDYGKSPRSVLEPDRPWEGTALSGPSPLRALGAVLLYYAGTEGIGVARSADGVVFEKVAGPVLTRDPTSWEPAPPRAPSVYMLPDGRFRMLYSAGNSIGEAESADGLAWRRIGSAPVLGPLGTVSLGPNEKPPFDGAAVSDPCAVPRTTPAGRWQLRVLYTGTSVSGTTAIGFAGRYGEAGPLDREALPVYAVGRHEAAPALLDLGATSILYVQEERSEVASPYLGIAAAVAPTFVTLPLPGDFADAP